MNALEPLWQIEEELAALVDSLDTCPPELLPELEQRIVQSVGAEMEKVDRVYAVLASLEGVMANAKTEIQRLQDRQQAAGRARERLEGYVLRVIGERAGKPLKGHNVTLSARRSEALVVTDAALVPSEFKRTTVAVDIPKQPIKDALKAGREVPGVTVEYREHLVRK